MNKPAYYNRGRFKKRPPSAEITRIHASRPFRAAPRPFTVAADAAIL